MSPSKISTSGREARVFLDGDAAAAWTDFLCPLLVADGEASRDYVRASDMLFPKLMARVCDCFFFVDALAIEKFSPWLLAMSSYSFASLSASSSKFLYGLYLRSISSMCFTSLAFRSLFVDFWLKGCCY